MNDQLQEERIENRSPWIQRGMLIVAGILWLCLMVAAIGETIWGW